jgi:hypothetical protein
MGVCTLHSKALVHNEAPTSSDVALGERLGARRLRHRSQYFSPGWRRRKAEVHNRHFGVSRATSADAEGMRVSIDLSYSGAAGGKFSDKI